MLENGSGTDLKRQGKHHHRLALVMLPLPLPLDVDDAAEARSVHTLKAHSHRGASTATATLFSTVSVHTGGCQWQHPNTYMLPLMLPLQKMGIQPIP